jgi:hypothetical protein
MEQSIIFIGSRHRYCIAMGMSFQTAPTGDFPVVSGCQYVFSSTSNLLFLTEHIMHFDFHVCNLS